MKLYAPVGRGVPFGCNAIIFAKTETLNLASLGVYDLNAEGLDPLDWTVKRWNRESGPVKRAKYTCTSVCWPISWRESSSKSEGSRV